MAVPDFQTLMFPMLKLIGQRGPINVRDVKESLANELGLSDADRQEMLSSGVQPKFDNRIGWARTHLKYAGLIEYPSRGVYCITERGNTVLKSGITKIDNTYLNQFPGFAEFRKGRGEKEQTVELNPERTETPEELLESSHATLRSNLAAELLQALKSSTPSFFERVVVDVLVKMGYGGTRADAGQAVGKSGDGGIDGIIKEDRLGLDAIYLQAKRWDTPVGRPEIQKFAGALQGNRARKGVFITTSSFSSDAKDYVSRIESRIVLIDGVTLADLMIDHGVGVNTVAAYEVKRVDSDYFEEN